MSKSNVIVFVDYENLHFNLINNYKNIFELSLFEKLKLHLIEKDYNIVNIISYCNFDIKDMYNSHHQTKLQQIGIETRHTSNNGKNYADIQITVDVLEQIYLNKEINGVVLISNDKDMTPLIKAIKRNNNFIYLITTKNDFDKILLEFPNEHKFLKDLLNETVYFSDFDLEETVFNNLNDYQNKNPRILISLDKYLQNMVTFNKIFEYELVRILSILESENLILAYEYEMYSKKFIGVTTKEFFDNNTFTTTINIKPNYLDNYLKESYDNYNKN